MNLGIPSLATSIGGYNAASASLKGRCALPSRSASVPDGSFLRPSHDLEAFLALISSLSGRLAGATGDEVDREVEAGLRDLLTFFGVEQCGILEFQPDRRKARLRHVAYLEGVAPVPNTIDYGAALPW